MHTLSNTSAARHRTSDLLEIDAWPQEQRRLIIRWVLESIKLYGQSSSRGCLWIHKEFPREVMLAVLTYCYAVGVLESNAIATNVRNDSIIARLCPERELPAELIRNFRRGHREILVRCLVHVFSRALVEGYRPETLGEESSIDWERPVMVSDEYEGFSDPEELAKERIGLAVMLDSVALDD